MIISGKEIAEKIIEKLKTESKPDKFFAAVLVGDPESSSGRASSVFIRQKEKAAKELGVDFRLYKFPENIKNDELREEVLKISKHKTCGGVIVQLPLPNHINKHYILNVIPREKDVDVLGERSLGAFYTDRNPILPPAVATLEEILRTSNFELRTAKVAVVGLGFLVGKPISVWLQGKAKEIILFDEGSDFLLLKEANLVITGVGKAGIIKPDMLHEEAVVIDFGISAPLAHSQTDADLTQTNADSKKLFGGISAPLAHSQTDADLTLRQAQGISQTNADSKKYFGDFDSSSLDPKPHTLNPISYTPTPGGTGPILVAKLLENFYTLNGKSAKD